MNDFKQETLELQQELEKMRNERDSTLDKGEVVAQRIANLTM